MIERKFISMGGAGQRSMAMTSAVNVSGVRTRQIPNLDIPDLPGAACKGIEDFRIFHPTTPDVDTSAAKAMCNACPVKQKCLDWCLDWEKRHGEIQGGIWGGVTEWERRERGNPEGRRMCQSGRHEIAGANLVIWGGIERCRACHNEINARLKRERRARAKQQQQEADQIGA